MAQAPQLRYDAASWQAGYRAGYAGGKPAAPPPGVADDLAFWSGVIEGQADRALPNSAPQQSGPRAAARLPR